MKGTFLLAAYLQLASSGGLVFTATPSRSLEQQGGPLITIVWGVLCLVCGLAGCAGLLARRPLLEVVASFMGITASLTWAAALVLQAVHTRSALPLTAACMVGALTAMFAERWAELASSAR